MNDITRPLVLAGFSHSAGSGYGCAMNVLSWENGDATITDTPACTDQMLAVYVQELNDLLATVPTDTFDPEEGDVIHVVPAEQAVKVLAIAHRTVGSGELDDETKGNAIAAFVASLKEQRGGLVVITIATTKVPWTMTSYLLFGELVGNLAEGINVVATRAHLQPDAIFERFNTALDAYWAAAHAEPTPVPETVTAEAVCKMQEVVA